MLSPFSANRRPPLWSVLRIVSRTLSGHVMCPTLKSSRSRCTGGRSMKLYPISYKGRQDPKRSTKRMSHERKAKLRGALIRRLLVINAVLYVFAVVGALSGNAAVLLLPVGVTAM